MSVFEIVFPFLLITVAASFQQDESFLEFHAAVLNAYDDAKSFSENFYVILDAICPNSVYCPDAVNSKDFKPDVEKEIHEQLENHNSSFAVKLVSEALEFISNRSSNIRGCCTRCSCENDCTEKNNCCLMRNATMLTVDVTAEPKVKQECVTASIHSYLQGGVLLKQDSMGLGYYMVTDCFDKNAEEIVANKCRHPNVSSTVEITPVYSFVSGRNYKNRFCAECNTDFNFTFWHPVIIFSDIITFTGNHYIPTSAQELKRHYLLSKFSTLVYEPPEAIQNDIENHKCLISGTGEYRKGVENCKNFSPLTEIQNSFFKHSCAFKENIRFETTRVTFDNVFCFMCSDPLVTWNSDRPNNCDGTPRFFPHSFSAMLSLDETQSEPLYASDDDGYNAKCTCTEFFDTEKGICRQLMCSAGEHFVNCQCQPFLTNFIGMTVKFHLEIVPVEEKHSVKLGSKIGNSKQKGRTLMSTVVNVLNSTWGPLFPTAWILYRETSGSNEHYVKFYNVLIMTIGHSTGNRQVIEHMFYGLHRGLTTTVFKIPVRITLGKILKHNKIEPTTKLLFDDRHESELKREFLILDIQNPTLVNSRQTYVQPISKLIFCKRVKLEVKEVEVLQSGSFPGLSPTYLGYIYNENDDSICLDDFESLFIQHGSSSTYTCCMFIIAQAVVTWGFVNYRNF